VAKAPGPRHREIHLSIRGGWLRAAVLGSNDAIVSTSSLMMGVAAAAATPHAVLVAGIAGLVAGSMSMAVGEFVSVSSQHDAEVADIAKEQAELEASPQAELKELAGIYRERGLDADLAMQVAHALTEHDKLAAHLRDELGIHPEMRARPFQAAWISAVSFAVFAMVPILALLAVPHSLALYAIPVASIVALACLGSFGAYLGGAPMPPAALRVTIGGGLGMAITTAIGHLLGVTAG
jgi:VIT1/CCC1 family predicted Fe2+/Mn2+ transporter